MKDHSRENDNSLPQRRAEGDSDSSSGSHQQPYERQANGHQQPQQHRANGQARSSHFGPWTLVELLAQRWYWAVLGTVAAGVAFGLLGWHIVKPKFTASAQLLRYEPPGKSETFKTTPVSGDTFAGLLRAPELLRQVGQKAEPPIPPETLTKCLKIEPDPDSDMVKVQLAAREPQFAVNLLNIYLTNAVDFMRAMESRQAALLANDYLKIQVTQMDRDITELQEQLRHLPVQAVTNKLARMGGQLQRYNAAIGDLNDLLLTYTELHPKVQAKRAQIKELQEQIASSSTNTSPANDTHLLNTDFSAPGQAINPESEIIHIKLRAVEDSRLELVKRAREAELYAAEPPGTVRIFAQADPKTVKTNLRVLKVGIVTVFGGLLGLGISLALALLVELMDSRLKTADDVGRVTRLPVLTSLGNLESMLPEARAQWAFRAWTLLQGRLSPSSDFGLVCGITSSASGEGRSTWINLLSEAASLAGYRVLTIATRPTPTHVNGSDEFPENLLTEHKKLNGENGVANSLSPSVLAAPGTVTERLTGPNSQPAVHIPLPGWVWNLERRKQWREALQQWRQIENLVIFVELPPADMPEAVLLGASLPNLLWLSSSGTAEASQTRTQIDTLRNARCNLVGAVLNREPAVPLRERFPRWFGCMLLLASLGLQSGWSQQTNASPAPGPFTALATAEQQPVEAGARGSFSISRPTQRAAWQQHLTLGPGDALTFGIYGQPELTRADVPIAPDGTVNYLEATNVQASGLTVDELRAKLDQELGQYRRAPHTILTPTAFRSKKYYVLGKVTTKGVYTLDRPLTVLEALARAHGLESALIDRDMVSLADFQRSFLSRAGKLLPLNFEQLFQQGDLSQNIAIEPGDYIYFAPGDVNEVYVVGEVRLPGPTTWTPGMTIIGAITARGGYTERAFKARVIVVRGSLTHPEAIVVNTHAILDANAPDFALKPRDIIFVNSRPFIKIEEAADLAATAFIQSVITSWVGVDVVKPFK